MKVVALYLLLYIPIFSFSQQQIKSPLENPELMSLLQNEPTSNNDSMQWVRKIVFCNGDSLDYCPLYSEITINSVIQACGENFYQLTDSAILEVLESFIDSQYQDIIRKSNDIESSTEGYLKEFKSINVPSIKEQLWERESYFAINYFNPAIQSTLNNKYVDLIASLTKDSSRSYWGDTNTFYKFIKNGDSAIRVIKELKNGDLKFELHLILLEKFLQLQCSESDIFFLFSDIQETFLRSSKYSILQKAMIYIAYGKALNTLGRKTKGSFVYFRMAASILFQNKLPTEFNKLQLIISDYILNQRQEEYSRYLMESVQSFLRKEMFYRNVEKRYNLTVPEFFRKVLEIANYEIAVTTFNIKKDNTITQRRRLILTATLFCLSKYIHHKEISTNEALIRDFHIVFRDYYRLFLQSDKALEIQKQIISNSKKSSSPLIKFKCVDDLKMLVNIERDRGNVATAAEIYSQLKNTLVYVYPGPEVNKHYTFSFPSDFRLWNRDQFSMLIDTVIGISVNSFYRYEKGYMWYIMKSNFGMEIDELCRVLGKRSIDQKHWETGAILLLKADSSRTDENQREIKMMHGAAIYGEYLPKIYEKESTIEELSTYLIIGSGVLLLISILATLAVRERKRAKREEAKSTILAQTMHQIAHLAPQCIDKIYEKQKTGTTPDIEVLNNLSVTLRMFHDYSQKKKITYAEELTLVRSFINLAYAKEAGQKPAIKIRSNVRDYPDVTLPTYILFNAVQNAYKHGFVGDKEDSYVDVSLNQNQYGYSMTITNEAFESKTEESTTKTGIIFMQKILRYWNNDKTDQLHYRFEDNKFILEILFKANGKI